MNRALALGLRRAGRFDKVLLNSTRGFAAKNPAPSTYTFSKTEEEWRADLKPHEYQVPVPFHPLPPCTSCPAPPPLDPTYPPTQAPRASGAAGEGDGARLQR